MTGSTEEQVTRQGPFDAQSQLAHQLRPLASWVLLLISVILTSTFWLTNARCSVLMWELTTIERIDLGGRNPNAAALTYLLVYAAVAVAGLGLSLRCLQRRRYLDVVAGLLSAGLPAVSLLLTRLYTPWCFHPGLVM